MKNKRPKPLTDKAKRKKGLFEPVDSLATHKDKQRKKVRIVRKKQPPVIKKKVVTRPKTPVKESKPSGKTTSVKK